MVSQISVNELLKSAQQLSAKDFDLFFKKIIKLRSDKESDGQSEQERRLLNQIKAGMPYDLEQRYAHLIAKRDLGTLTEAEYEDLLALTEKAEQHQTNRLRLMVELAHLKGLTLQEVVTRYKLQPKAIN